MFGIAIAMCCASCKFKEMRNQYRYCTKGGKIPRPTFVCHQWEMADVYQKIGGKADGRIKSREYLAFALDKLTEGHTENARRMSLNDIREEFLKDGGRIYSIDD